MRILTGKYKGRLIKMPRGIRPTQNKVRKAIFDILGDLEGALFLELFSGSGAIGFEALSRGAKNAVLVENNRESLSVIQENIRSLNLANCEPLPFSSEKALGVLARGRRRFDIIFLDPPYYQDMAKKTLQLIGAYDILAANGFIIVQHFIKDNLPDSQGGLILYKRFKYGDTLLSVYNKHVPESHISR